MIYGLELKNLPQVNIIGHSVCAKDWKLPIRTIDDFEIIVVYQGEATFCKNNIEYPLVQGDVLMINPQEQHSAFSNTDNPCRFYFIHFSINKPLEYLEVYEVTKQIDDSICKLNSEKDHEFWAMPETFLNRIYFSPFIQLRDCKDEVFTLFEKAFIERNKGSLNSQLMISSYLVQILIILTRLLIQNIMKENNSAKLSEVPRMLQKAVSFIYENYLEALSVQKVCQHTGISSQYLTRLFKNHFGISPIQYINQLKICYAKHLIRNSSMSMKEISYTIGIKNPYYFSRLFKKIEGIQPTLLIKGLEIKSNE